MNYLTECVFQHYLKTKNNGVNVPTHASHYYVTQLAIICTKIRYFYYEGTDVLLLCLCFEQMLIPQETVGPIKLYAHKPTTKSFICNLKELQNLSEFVCRHVFLLTYNS